MSAALTIQPQPCPRNAHNPYPCQPLGTTTASLSDDVRAPHAPRSGAEAAGLVSSETSSPREVTLDRNYGRQCRKKRFVTTAARMIASEVESGWHCFMVTLTYRDGTEWQPRHVSEYLNRLEKWAQRKGCKPLVVMSMEPSEVGRTVPHYHLLIWLPKRLMVPKADKRGWWTHGLTQSKFKIKSAGAYISKYLEKGTGAALPRGARCCSCRGLSAVGRAHRAFLMLPRYMQEVATISDRVMRARGGGWQSRETGERWPARWKLVERAKDWSWIKFAEVASDLPARVPGHSIDALRVVVRSS